MKRPLKVGDRVRVYGYSEDGGFAAGAVYDFSEKPVLHDLFPNGPWHEFIEVKKK